MHMGRWLALLVVLLLISGAALAQNEEIKTYAPADFEKFLKEDVKKEFKKREKDDSYLYDVTESFRVLFQVNSKALLFYEKYKYELPKPLDVGKDIMAAKVKYWNTRKAKISRAEVEGSAAYGKESSLHTVKFSGTLDLSAGVSRKKVSDYYATLDNEFDEWVIFMQDLLKHEKKLKK
jgi:hypothetical protein